MKSRTVVFQGKAAGTTIIHCDCGATVENTGAVMLTCPFCNLSFDQDVNAARNLLSQIPAAL